MTYRNIDSIQNALSSRTSRRRALRIMGGGLVGGSLLGGAAIAAGINGATAQRPTFSDNYELPVVEGVLGDGGAATLAPTSFLSDGGVLSVVGNVLDAAGELVGSFTGTVDTAQTEASCDILNLALGPLELDLLGLVVEIPEPVFLNIFAEPGEGNLLGNLLCAVAGLLNGSSPAGGLAGLLNNILRALGLA